MTGRRSKLALSRWGAIAIALGVSAAAGGCAHQNYYPGTTIVRSEENRKII